jgi:hypothetical protein
MLCGATNGQADACSARPGRAGVVVDERASLRVVEGRRGGGGMRCVVNGLRLRRAEIPSAAVIEMAYAGVDRVGR